MGGGGLAAAPGASPLADATTSSAPQAPATSSPAAQPVGPGSAQPAPTQPAAAQPAAASTFAAVPPPSPAVSLEGTIRLAAEQGFQRARLTLQPAELGNVDVVLKASEGGVSASVLAHTPEAARLLEAAGHELRQRLGLQGVQLQSLTVAVAGDAAAGAGHQRQGEAAPNGAASQGPGSGPATDSPDQPPTPTRRIELGGGVLLDVIA